MKIALIQQKTINDIESNITKGITAVQEAANKFGDVLVFLKSIDDEMKQIELILEKHGAPYTPGRFPQWKQN